MKTANDVAELIKKGKDSGESLMNIAWKTALACTGWAYVFGARGEYCTPANRRAYYKSKGAEHPTIKSKCKNFDGSGSCSGCKFYPGGQTRFFDCRGFTYWVLLQVYGWKLMGAGCTSQWSNGSNWKSKGTIDTMPKDTLVCLFVQKGKTMEHTGFGYNNETVECSSGVQHFNSRNKKWTHWGLPVCISESSAEPPVSPSEPSDEETPVKSLPTLKRGSKGEYVTALQTMLKNKGYDLGKSGVDGDFGSATLAAVKKFQKDHGLDDDGIVGQATWAALEKQETMQRYSVTVRHLTESQAKALAAMYTNAEIEKEVG